MSVDEEYYVLLETGNDERFVTESELREYLATLLTQEQNLHGQELQQTVTHTLNTACVLPLGPGRYCEWYATRLDRPSTRRKEW
jgi:predicted RNA-binding protein (virulence factor B family)